MSYFNIIAATSGVKSMGGGTTPVDPPVVNPITILAIGDSLGNGTNEIYPNDNSDDSTQGVANADTLYEWDGNQLLDRVGGDTIGANNGSQYPSMANKIKELTGKPVHLIECATGGAEFSPNGDGLNYSTSGFMYGDTLIKANSYISQYGGIDLIKITLGINDARGGASLTTIESDAQSLINRLRNDFPNTPMLINQLGKSNASSTRVTAVRGYIDSLVTNNDFVHAGKDLDDYPSSAYFDGLHLTQEYNNIFGEDDALLIPNIINNSSFDDTRELRLKSYLYEDRYYFTGVYQKNPTNGVILHTFHDGTNHTWQGDKKVSGMRSTDGGETHSSVFELVDPPDTSSGANLGVQDVGGGYDSNGRYHLFYDAHGNDTSPTAQHYACHNYSDDDGATWSERQVIFDTAGTEYWSLRMFGKMIENNGVLMKPYYRSNRAELSKRMLLRSTDYGVSWQEIEVDSTSGDSINEGSLIALDNQVIYAARKNGGDMGCRFYISNDNGLTWSLQGETAFGETIGKSHPPHLAKFKIDGQDVFCFYFHNRSTYNFMGIYGKPADVFADVSGWNLNTKTIFFSINNPFFEKPNGSEPGTTSGYPMVDHIDGDLFAKGMIYADYTGESAIIHYDLPTTHYQTIKTELGL